MPQIIVAADRGAAFGEGAVTFRERVNIADFQSEHFAAQLLERLGWAVEDADVAERRREEPVAEADPIEKSEPVEETEPVEDAEPVEKSEPVETRLEESVAVHA